MLANRVEQQVVIVPHPCMETAVILDPTAEGRLLRIPTLNRTSEAGLESGDEHEPNK